MKKEETPPSAGTLEGGQTSVKNGNRLSSGERFGQVDYYDGKGVVLRSGFVKSAGKPPTNVKRGRVGGFSKSARRRMRQWMLTHSAPDGWSVHGATFTIPGPVLPDDLERSIWKWFCREFQRKGWGMVWRLELQRRGARHFHALCILPNDVPSHNVVFLWWDALRSVGSVTYSGGCVQRVGSLMAHFGALDYSCRMQSDGGGRGAWMRYLADHASKSKECQEAIGKGRHWGVVGRNRFVQVFPDRVEHLDEQAYYRFLRVYRRLCQTSKKASCVFGRKLGYRPKFGLFGNTVKFSRPETVKRLADWAVSVQDWGGKL